MRPALKQLKGKNLVGVEVGVASGVHALEMLQNLDLKRLYLVDVWGEYVEEGIPGNTADHEERARELLKDYKQVVFLKGLSVEMAKQIKEKVDFVYIDANHQYEFVKADILAWLPKVKKGGMICGHDFGRDGVYKAVLEIFPYGNFPNRDKDSSDDWWAISI